MASLFDEELERQRQQLQSVGVTPEMTDMAAATPEPVTQDNLLQMPMSPMERMMEEDGKAKTIGKMLLGGFTGTMPFMFPGMAGEKKRYEHELAAYYDQQDQLRTQNQASAYQDMLYDDDPDNDIKALQMGAIMQPDVYGPVLRDRMQQQFNPDPESFTEGEYQLNPETGRWEWRMQGNRGTINTVEMQEGFMPESRMWSPDARESAIGAADTAIRDSEQRLVGINDLNNAMEEIGPERWTAGIKGQLGEEWKKLSGAEDAISQAKMQFNRIKNTIAVQNLPPGVASDKDIDLVMQGFPTDASNFETVQQYVKQMQALEQRIQAYKKHESKWITEKGTRAGMEAAWTKKQEGFAQDPKSPFYDGDKAAADKATSDEFDKLYYGPEGAK